MKLFKEIAFWIGILIVLVMVFGYRINDFAGAFMFTSFLMPVLIGSSYVFSEYIIPKFLLERKYFRFGLYSVYTLIITLNLTILTMVLSFSILANYRYDEMLPASRDVFVLALIILFIALLKSSWNLLRMIFVQAGTLQQLEAKDRLRTEGILHVKADRKEYRIALEDITHIESMADYIKINKLDGSSIITREKISAIANRLPSTFLRIHRSFLINLDHSGSFKADAIEVNGQTLPVGRKFKPDVREVLDKKSGSLTTPVE